MSCSYAFIARFTWLLMLQVLIVTADEDLLKSLREANRLLEQVRTQQQPLKLWDAAAGSIPKHPLSVVCSGCKVSPACAARGTAVQHQYSSDASAQAALRQRNQWDMRSFAFSVCCFVWVQLPC